MYKINVLIFLFLFFFITFALESNQSSTATQLEFSDLIQTRHSGYSFDSTKPVSTDLFPQLAEAARLTPSSYNDQPWRFIFCDLESTPIAYQKALNSLVEANKKWAKNAPLLIIVCADTISKYNQKPNRWAEYDTGAAAMSLVYQATSLGLMSHQMGGFDLKKIRQDFSIPSQWTPMAVIAVGYEKESEEKNTPQKKRLPLEEIFFLGDLKTGLH